MICLRASHTGSHRTGAIIDPNPTSPSLAHFGHWASTSPRRSLRKGSGWPAPGWCSYVSSSGRKTSWPWHRGSDARRPWCLFPGPTCPWFFWGQLLALAAWPYRCLVALAEDSGTPKDTCALLVDCKEDEGEEPKQSRIKDGGSLLYQWRGCRQLA